MQDGRLFTDYRPNCFILKTVDDKDNFVRTGETHIRMNRSTAVMTAGFTPHVDTMVPEFTKRMCGADSCVTVMNEPIGIGQGRIMGTATLPNTFSQDPRAYTVMDRQIPVAAEHRGQLNRFSVPYGN
jgi:hypothetical protein